MKLLSIAFLCLGVYGLFTNIGLGLFAFFCWLLSAWANYIIEERNRNYDYGDLHTLDLDDEHKTPSNKHRP